MTNIKDAEAVHTRIPARLITVDNLVQRSLDRLRVDKIVETFKPEALGTIVLSHRADGTYHCIDGQHRVAAQMIKDGEAEMLATVWSNLTRAEEAAMFRLLNNTRPVGVLDRFRVRVAEGDEVAVTITKMLNGLGWSVETSKRDGAFAAAAAIENAWYRGGADPAGMARAVIEIPTQAWGHNAHGVRREMIDGLSLLLARYGEAVDRPKLIKELSLFPGGALGLIGRAKSLRDIRGGRNGDAMAEILVGLLNKGRRVKLLPPWLDE